MKLSQYIRLIPYDNTNTILYNTSNQNIVLLNNDYIDIGNHELNEHIGKDDLEYLHIKSYFIDQETVSNRIKNAQVNGSEFNIEINMTECCNISCPYCYQNSIERYSSISYETIEHILIYIRNICEKVNLKNVSIYFFGGEPLLEQRKIVYIKRRIDEMSYSLKFNVSYGIGTNGLLLRKGFVEHFESLTVDLPLSHPIDHDKYRVYKNGSGSFDKIINNLREIKHLLGEVIDLNIRYNVNHENINYFPEFLQLLKSENIICKVKTAYTDNYDYNSDYENKLDKNDYKKWVSVDCVNELVKHGFPVVFTQFWGLYPNCTAYEKYSCKFFSDGSLALCDATSYFKRLKINLNDLDGDFELINRLYSKFKGVNNKDIPKCKHCPITYLCRGEIYCNQNGCKDNFDFDNDLFIKNFVRHCQLGNKDLFTSL